MSIAPGTSAASAGLPRSIEPVLSALSRRHIVVRTGAVDLAGTLIADFAR
jgi:hypothetical protein